MCVKQLVNILDHMGFELHVACRDPVNNALYSCRDFPQYSQLLTTIVQLHALQIGHAQLQLPHKIVIDHGEGWGWKLRCGEHGEWPPFNGEDEFSVTLFSIVTRGNMVGFESCHFLSTDDWREI